MSGRECRTTSARAMPEHVNLQNRRAASGRKPKTRTDKTEGHPPVTHDNPPIRWGIIGCGSMGREHIENIVALGGAVVTAIADPHAPSREAALAVCAAGRLDPQVFEDHRELLASGLCDAVAIATPNFTHAQMVRDALPTAPQAARRQCASSLCPRSSRSSRHVVVVVAGAVVKLVVAVVAPRFVGWVEPAVVHRCAVGCVGFHICSRRVRA